MRLVITGGRDFTDSARLNETLDLMQWHRRIDILIEGDARGADKMAGKWAKANGIKLDTKPAQWKLYGNAAGPLRNQQMIDEGNPNCCLAFPGGTGTADMVTRCKKAGIYIINTLQYVPQPPDWELAMYAEFHQEMFRIWCGYEHQL